MTEIVNLVISAMCAMTTMSYQSLEEIRQWMEDFLWPDPDERQRGRRRQILQAATELFVEFGYRKTSVDEVAARAGIAKGTVYLYYRNKAELVFHAIALEKSAYIDRVEPLLDSSQNARDRLRSLIALSMVLVREMPLLNRVNGDRDMELAIRDLDTSVLTGINEFQMTFFLGLLDEATDRRLEQTALVERAQVLIDLLMAITASATPVDGGSDLEDYARLMARTIVDGITHPPDGQVQVTIPGSGLAIVKPQRSLQEVLS